MTLSSPATGGTGLLGNIMVCDTEVDDDYVVTGVVHVVGTTNDWNDTALVFGYQDDSNHYYVILNESDNDNTHGVFKVVGGSYTQLANISSTITSDIDYEIEVERIGSSIVVKIDDTQVASVTDSTFVGGQFGFGSKNDECQFDDLVVDDFGPPSIDEDFSTSAANFDEVLGGTWSVSSGRYQLTSPATGGVGLLGNISVHDTIFSGDYTVSGLVRVVGTTNEWNDVALVFGYQDANNHYYAILNESNNSNTHGLFKVVSGTPTELVDFASVSFASDTDYTLEVERSGALIVVKLNGSQIASTTDSTFVGGQFGFGSKNDACQFDNLSVEGSIAPAIDEAFASSAANFEEDLGGTWSVSSGRYQLSSPATGGTGLMGNISVHNATFSGDYSVSGLVRVVGTTNEWNDVALVFGYQDEDNHYYAVLNETDDGNTNTHGLFKVVSGTPTELVDFSGVTFVSDTDYILEVIRSGSSIVVYLDDTQIASTTDSTFTGGKVGFGSKNDECQFDDLIAYGTASNSVSAPEFSPGGGTYSTTQSVSISSDTSGATIRYTLDGSTPTSTSGTVYTSAISISSTTTLKAIAYKSGLSDSSVTSDTYTIVTSGYYVDPSTGSMSNPGTYSQPWSTLEAVFAASKTFSPGDVIYLRDGNHGQPVITSVNTGDVTIKNQSGHDPRIERIEFDTAKHWVLDGVTVHDGGSLPTTPDGINQWPMAPKNENFLIKIIDGSEYVTVKNCYIYSHDDTTIASWSATDWHNSVWNGIDINESPHILVESTDIRNIRFGIRNNSNSDYNTFRSVFIENFAGDGIKFDSDYVTVEYCWIQNCYDVNANHDDAIQFLESASNGVIRGNTYINYIDSAQPFKTDGGHSFAGFHGPHEDWVIENNIIVNGHLHGIALWGAVDCVIVNNTIVPNPFNPNPGSQKAAISIQNGDGGANPPSGNQIRNNIMRYNYVKAGAGTFADNLVVTSNYTDYFVDYDNFDFHLKSTATSAIDQGDATYAPADDWDGETRDSNPDIGADEY